jgi:hypothetical protein
MRKYTCEYRYRVDRQHYHARAVAYSDSFERAKPVAQRHANQDRLVYEVLDNQTGEVVLVVRPA